jgi:iron complex outermembrane receptor protein
MYQTSGSFSIYASAGHGFSNPTVEEGLSSEGVMNSGLRPEQGWSIDLGAKSVFFNSRLTLQGSVYAILLNDLLVIKRPEETVFYGSNAGSSVLKGLEAMVDFRPVKQIRYTLTASLRDNRFKEFEEEGMNYSGKQLPGIPIYQLYSGLETVLSPHFRLNFTYRRTGTQYADDANTVKVKAWQTCDMSITYEAKLFKSFRLRTQFAVNNLFDAHYASMVLINAPSFSGRPPRYYYPALPRNFNTGIQLKW